MIESLYSWTKKKNVSAYVAGRYADLYQILLLKKSDATVIVIYQVRRTEKKTRRSGEGGRRNRRLLSLIKMQCFLLNDWRTTGLEGAPR